MTDFEAAVDAASAASNAWARRSPAMVFVSPSRDQVRVMIRPEFDRAEHAEARLAEILQAVKTFTNVRVCGTDTLDLAEAVRQIAERKPAP